MTNSDVGCDLDPSIYVLIFLYVPSRYVVIYHVHHYGNRNWQDIFASIPTSILQLSDRKDELLGVIGLVVLHVRGEWI